METAKQSNYRFTYAEHSLIIISEVLQGLVLN